MAIATARICIDFVNQLLDGMDAITNDQRWLTSGSRNQFVANDQQAVVTARQELFDQNFTIASSCFVSLVKQFSLNDVDCDAFALVAVLGLDHNRKPNTECNLPSIF